MGGHASGAALAGAESRLIHLSIGEVCDGAYLLVAELVSARALADRQGAIVAAAMGADVGDLPDPAQEVARLDEALNAAPTPSDPKTRMARFLGVA